MSRILLPEGMDDHFVVIHVLQAHGIGVNPNNRPVDVKKMNGVEDLLEALPVIIKTGPQMLGVVLDADSDIIARWRSIEAILTKSGYEQVPSSPDKLGTIITEAGKPTIGIWIMPDNDSSGMLEHFISFLVPKNDPLWAEATSIVNSLVKSGRNKFPINHTMKATLRTWLAWQKDPGTSYADAITKKYLDHNCKEGLEFFDWLKRLFSL